MPNLSLTKKITALNLELVHLRRDIRLRRTKETPAKIWENTHGTITKKRAQTLLTSIDQKRKQADRGLVS